MNGEREHLLCIIRVLHSLKEKLRNTYGNISVFNTYLIFKYFRQFWTSFQFYRVDGKLKQKNIADGTANDKRLGDVRRLPLARCLINLTSVF